MSVESYIADDLFVIRTVKSLFANPDNKWANTYEFKAILPGSTDELLALALKVAAMESFIHYQVVKFEQVTVSTWDQDSVPYNPSAFISTSLSLFGQRATTGDAAPLSTCLSVARVAITGRLGHLFYRGVLVEGDVGAPAGKAVLSNPGVFNTLVEDAITDADMAEHIGLAAASLQLVMVSKNASNIRPVAGLVPVGVSQVPTDHAWYNRTVTP